MKQNKIIEIDIELAYRIKELLDIVLDRTFSTQAQDDINSIINTLNTKIDKALIK